MLVAGRKRETTWNIAKLSAGKLSAQNHPRITNTNTQTQIIDRTNTHLFVFLGNAQLAKDEQGKLVLFAVEHAPVQKS